MDYEFKKNTLDGSYRVELSSGHEALGYWLLEEVGSDVAQLDALLLQLGAQKNINQEWRLDGQDWCLIMEHNEIHVLANYLLNIEDEEFDDGMAAYEQESEAYCGIEDFEQFLLSWRQFVS